MPTEPPKAPPLPQRPPAPPPLRVVNTGPKLVLAPRIALDPLVITGKSVAIMGTNGSGKSGTARQFMEQHIAKKMPFTVADIENEYATLKELGEVYLAGPEAKNSAIKVDFKLTNSGEYHELARKAYEQSMTIVLLLGDIDDETRKLYLKSYIDGVFDAVIDPRTAHYYRLFLEEVQEYIPQVGLAKSDPLRQSIIRFGKRGRKRKLSLVLISQRPSNVDKDVLTQCHIFFLHYVTYPTDIDVYQDALGVKNAEERVLRMTPGEVIFKFGREMIDDKITRPRTVSPWDEAGTFDPSKFVEVADTTELQKEIIEKGASDEGMAVVQSAYLHKLERDNQQFQIDIQGLVDTQIEHEQEIAALKAREPVIVAGKDLTGDAAAIIARLTLERDRAQAAAVPIDLLVGILRERVSSP